MMSPVSHSSLDLGCQACTPECRRPPKWTSASQEMPPHPRNSDRPIGAPLLELDPRHRDTDVSLPLSVVRAATSVTADQTAERRARTRQRAWSTKEGAAQGEAASRAHVAPNRLWRAPGSQVCFPSSPAVSDCHELSLLLAPPGLGDGWGLGN